MEWDVKEVIDQVKLLNANQKIALLGFLLVKMADELKFRETMIEGIQQISHLHFDEFGFLTPPNGNVQ